MILRKQFMAALGAMILAAGVTSVAQAACTNGDVTGGGANIADVSAILQCNGTRANPPANPNPSVCNGLCAGAGILNCGDLNADGAITTADAIILINQLFNPSKNIVPICASSGPTLPCGSTIDALDGHITANEVLSGCQYFLKGTVFVDPGVVLTIRPGATIFGVQGATTPSALVFLASPNCSTTALPFSARINAAGTPSQPIVFTSDQPVGSRRSGDWAGVSFQGCSRVNVTGGIGAAEGLNGVAFGGGQECITDGGTAHCDESSGLFRYARIEFCGNELGPDNELNVLTQNSLGSNTNFTYLQAHMGLDDGFEWFGGTIREKHFVATANRDDNFDWQLGSDVKLQYGVAAQFLGNLDAQGNNGFEGDNNENGFSNLALSQPQFCNITVVGSRGQGAHPSGGQWTGVFLRRGTAGQIAKTIVTNLQSNGIQLRDPETGTHACLGDCQVAAVDRTDGTTACDGAPGNFTLVDTDATHKVCATGTNVGQPCTNANPDCPLGLGFSECRNHQNLLVRDTLFYGNGSTGLVNCGNKSSGNNTGKECNSCEFLGLLTSTPALHVASNAVFPDATLNPGIDAGPTWPPTSFVPTNTTVVSDPPSNFDCGVGFSNFFDSTGYLGAIDPAGTDWTQTPGGWISFVTQ